MRTLRAGKPPGHPSEAWISHEATDEQVGYALGHLCLGYTPECFRTGMCAYEGDCFHTDRSTARAAAAAIRKAAQAESPAVRDVMISAANIVMGKL